MKDAFLIVVFSFFSTLFFDAYNSASVLDDPPPLFGAINTLIAFPVVYIGLRSVWDWMNDLSQKWGFQDEEDLKKRQKSWWFRNGIPFVGMWLMPQFNARDSLSLYKNLLRVMRYGNAVMKT